jgi:hypothetical protein
VLPNVSAASANVTRYCWSTVGRSVSTTLPPPSLVTLAAGLNAAPSPAGAFRDSSRPTALAQGSILPVLMSKRRTWKVTFVPESGCCSAVTVTVDLDPTSVTGSL